MSNFSKTEGCRLGEDISVPLQVWVPSLNITHIPKEPMTSTLPLLCLNQIDAALPGKYKASDSAVSTITNLQSTPGINHTIGLLNPIAVPLLKAGHGNLRTKHGHHSVK